MWLLNIFDTVNSEVVEQCFCYSRQKDKSNRYVIFARDNTSNDPNWLTVESSEIQDDQIIVLIDSVFHWDLDESGYRIPETKKVSIDRKKFRVLESGKFEEIAFN